MTIYVKADGNYSVVFPANGRKFSLKELQFYVGGSIEMVHDGKGKVFVVNEEGKLNHLPLNPLATEIYLHFFDAEDFLVGNVLLCDDIDIE